MESLFYSLLFALTVVSAVMVVFSRHAVYAALYLIVTMISIAGIFIMIQAEFAAILQILVYAAAILMLFLFVIMLLNLGRQEETPPATARVRKLGMAMFVALLAQIVIFAARFGGSLRIRPMSDNAIAIPDVALALLTRYVYAFEATSIMLLIAIVGALMLSSRNDPDELEEEA